MADNDITFKSRASKTAKTMSIGIKFDTTSIKDSAKVVNEIEKATQKAIKSQNMLHKAFAAASEGVNKQVKSLASTIGRYAPALSLAGIFTAGVEAMIAMDRALLNVNASTLASTKSLSGMMSGWRQAGYSYEQINSAIKGSAFGLSDTELSQMAGGALQLNRYADIQIEQGAELIHTYTQVKNVYSSVSEAVFDLGATFSYAAKQYGMNTSEMISNLNLMETRFMGLDATMRKGAINDFLGASGALSKIGIASGDTANMMKDLGEITSESGARLRSAMLANSGLSTASLQGAFSNIGGAGSMETVLQGLVNTARSGAVQNIARVSHAKAAEYMGISEDMFAKLMQPGVTSAKLVADMKKMQDEAAKKATYQASIEKARGNLIIQLASIGGQIEAFFKTFGDNTFLPLVRKAISWLSNGGINTLGGMIMKIGIGVWKLVDFFVKNWKPIAIGSSIGAIIGAIAGGILGAAGGPAGIIAGISLGAKAGAGIGALTGVIGTGAYKNAKDVKEKHGLGGLFKFLTFQDMFTEDGNVATGKGPTPKSPVKTSPVVTPKPSNKPKGPFDMMASMFDFSTTVDAASRFEDSKKIFTEVTSNKGVSNLEKAKLAAAQETAYLTRQVLKAIQSLSSGYRVPA